MLVRIHCRVQSFSPTQYTIQRNTIVALQSLPGVEVVVFTQEAGVEALALDAGAEVVREFEVNSYGTPILRSMFKHVEHHASSKFVG